MGWLSSTFGGGSKTDDPIGKLDPKLRDFLEKESPVKFQQPRPATTSAPESTKEHADRDGKVPSASLYQDGRYAHLWKNYRPQQDVEMEGASDHDRLDALMDSYKSRKSLIGKAALENCALEQEEWVNCMKHGSWQDQMQMCKYQVRRFEKCHNMQGRFLKALGYASELGRPQEIEDKIQMHADSLYLRFVDYEKAVEQAKADGTPVPVFNPKIPSPKTQVDQETERKWKEKLEALPETERSYEEAALRADVDARAKVADQMKSIWQTKQDARDERMRQGQATISDHIMNLLNGGGNKPKQ